MNIQTFKVKHYNSTKKVVVTVNQVPVTVTRTEEEASLLISYLNGYNVELHDSSVKNALDAAKNGVEEKELYRVKSYCGRYFSIIMKNDIPVLLVSSALRAKRILAFTKGEESVHIPDKKVLKSLT